MSKTILVVDDEMLIALDIQSSLEELGHKVVIATAIAEAVALVDQQRIDIAIVDWHVGNNISATLVERLRQRQIPFLLCSGSALEELAALFPSSPIVTKPFAVSDLVMAIDAVAIEQVVN